MVVFLNNNSKKKFKKKNWFHPFQNDLMCKNVGELNQNQPAEDHFRMVPELLPDWLPEVLVKEPKITQKKPALLFFFFGASFSGFFFVCLFCFDC